jgi:hypothetical protein
MGNYGQRISTRMKFQTTRKDITNNYTYVMSIGYCDAQFLLKDYLPFAYTKSNMYGWQCDYYDVGGVCISEGYTPADDKNAKTDYELTRKLDRKAEKIRNAHLDFDNMTTSELKKEMRKRERKVRALLYKLIENSTGLVKVKGEEWFA